MKSGGAVENVFDQCRRYHSGPILMSVFLGQQGP